MRSVISEPGALVVAAIDRLARAAPVMLLIAAACSAPDDIPSPAGAAGSAGSAGAAGSAGQGGASPYAGVSCGAVTCEHICCASGGGCSIDGSDCLSPNGHGYLLACDGPEDCANGQVCCYGLGACACGGTSCTSAAECATLYPGTVLCHSEKDCPPGKSCTDKSPGTLLGTSATACGG